MLGATRDTVASTVSGVTLMVRNGTVGQGRAGCEEHLPMNAFDKNVSITKSLPRSFITTVASTLCLPCVAPVSEAGLLGEA